MSIIQAGHHLHQIYLTHIPINISYNLNSVPPHAEPNCLVQAHSVSIFCYKEYKDYPIFPRFTQVRETVGIPSQWGAGQVPHIGTLGGMSVTLTDLSRAAPPLQAQAHLQYSCEIPDFFTFAFIKPTLLKNLFLLHLFKKVPIP